MLVGRTFVDGLESTLGDNEIVTVIERRLYRGDRDGFEEVRVEVDGTAYEALSLGDDVPDIVADDVQIQQVVLDLIRNAIEATQPFFSTKRDGMGMGLSISRSIVEAHGGQIGYRPSKLGGSAFFFQLPSEQRRAAAMR